MLPSATFAISATSMTSAGEARRDRMMTLAREGKCLARWQRYELAYAAYAELEEEGPAISTFQSSVIHGLLYTADYARADHENSMPRLDPSAINLHIEAKLIWQRILTQASPPTFAVMLDEAALHRLVGGRQVMVDQLAKLLDMSALPNVKVQVLPFEPGAHPAVESNFTILQLPDPAPGVVFVEGMIGSTYLERPQDIERYQQVFEHLYVSALNPQESIEPSWVRLIFTGGSYESD